MVTSMQSRASSSGISSTSQIASTQFGVHAQMALARRRRLITVYVTCTGSDLGLASQCSEIGAGTGGHYVDSANSAQLPEAFADFHERIIGHEAVESVTGDLGKLMQTKGPAGTAFIETGSQSASFVLQWTVAAATADMIVRDPEGNTYDTQGMAQGRFLRVANPTPGEWQMIVESRGVASPFVVRAYTRNPSNHMAVGVRYPSVQPHGCRGPLPQHHPRRRYLRLRLPQQHGTGGDVGQTYPRSGDPP